MQGGTAATQDVFIEHVGIPTLPAVRLAVEALQELGMHRQVQLIVSGGIRSGADVAKALALGADAVSIGTAAMIALGDNSPELEAEYQRIGTSAGYYDDWQAGRDPAGISTQEDELAARLDPELGGRRLANYLRVHDARVPDARPRLRQVARPQPRARGPRRAHASRPRRWRRCRSRARAGFPGRDLPVPSASPCVLFALSCPNVRVLRWTCTIAGHTAPMTHRHRVPNCRAAELSAYVYFRGNVAGVQREWWYHRVGCGLWFVAERDTRTNEVLRTEFRHPTGRRRW